MAQLLTGVRVLDLTRAMTGPFCTLMLGDMGADVVKVELPGKGDEARGWGPPFVEGGESAYFLSVNRNKRSVTLNLRSDAGKAIAWKLIEWADVLVENFSPGAMDRLGLGPEAARARNPRLIYCSISGFGQTGPGRDKTAYDLIVQGMSGLMSITGDEAGPPTKMGVPIADITAGMFAAYAVVSALYQRERTGEGQRIDTSMLGCRGGAADLPGRHLLRHRPSRRGARATSTPSSPPTRPIPPPTATSTSPSATTASGSASARRSTGRSWPTTSASAPTATGAPTATSSKPSSRRASPRGRPPRSWPRWSRSACRAARSTTSPRSSPTRRRSTWSWSSASSTRPPARSARPASPTAWPATPCAIRRPPPTLGQHTDEVLAELGYDAEAIARLRADAVL